MSEKLKPCKLCGSEPVQYFVESLGINKHYCGGKYCTLHLVLCTDDEWNKLHGEKPNTVSMPAKLLSDFESDYCDVLELLAKLKGEKFTYSDNTKAVLKSLREHINKAKGEQG